MVANITYIKYGIHATRKKENRYILYRENQPCTRRSQKIGKLLLRGATGGRVVSTPAYNAGGCV